MKRVNVLKSFSTRLLFSAVAAMALSLSAQAADYVPKIIAGVVKADSWTMGNNKEGIYQLEVKENGQLTQLSGERDVISSRNGTPTSRPTPTPSIAWPTTCRRGTALRDRHSATCMAT